MLFKWGCVAVVVGLVSACGFGRATAPSPAWGDAQMPPRLEELEVPPPPPAKEGVCRLSDLRFAIGQPISSQLVEDVRQRSGAQSVRILDAGEPVTLKPNPQRLTLVLDSQDKVKMLRCR